MLEQDVEPSVLKAPTIKCGMRYLYVCLSVLVQPLLTIYLGSIFRQFESEGITRSSQGRQGRKTETIGTLLYRRFLTRRQLE